jgi:hypothetical protein
MVLVVRDLNGGREHCLSVTTVRGIVVGQQFGDGLEDWRSHLVSVKVV